MRRILLCSLFAAIVLAQSGAPTVDPAYGLDTYLTGNAAVGSGPVVAYDVTYPARARLGEGTVDENGKFAISVDPPLKVGNRIIVENAAEVGSSPIVVQGPRPGPAPR